MQPLHGFYATTVYADLKAATFSLHILDALAPMVLYKYKFSVFCHAKSSDLSALSSLLRAEVASPLVLNCPVPLLFLSFYLSKRKFLSSRPLQPISITSTHRCEPWCPQYPSSW